VTRGETASTRFIVCRASLNGSPGHWWEVVDRLDDGPDSVIAEYRSRILARSRALEENLMGAKTGTRRLPERGPFLTRAK
jgi:hypothetical protein